MQLVQTQKNGYKFAAFIHLLQSLADIKNMKILSSVTPDYSISQSQSFRMDAVYQYAINHYAENIKLSHIAGIANMTTQAFCRYFKKHTQKTFVNFLNEIRINEACKKLTDTGFDSIATVAYSTGFNSPVSFNRVFKNITGRSPGMFLREFNEKVN